MLIPPIPIMKTELKVPGCLLLLQEITLILNGHPPPEEVPLKVLSIQAIQEVVLILQPELAQAAALVDLQQDQGHLELPDLLHLRE